jgi:putative membrane protein
MMHWFFGDYGMGFGHGMGIFMIFFWLLIILGIILLVRIILGGGERSGRTAESAEEILKKRYARGEISEEQYRRMRENLR